MEWILYKKKFGLQKKTKIFICQGYASFKKALIDRGWHENTDCNSNIFHLKFLVRRDDIFMSNGNKDGNIRELHDF